MNTIRILVADGHTVVRAGLKALLGAHPEMEVIGEAADGATALRLATDLDPDVVVVEVFLPDLDGAQVTERLRESRAGQKVLALTACEEPDELRRLLEVGAVGYVLKRAPADELVQAIRTVAAGGTYLDPTLAIQVVNETPPPAEGGNGSELSEREALVVRMIAQGYSNKEIAARLKLSVKTVETYKTRAMEKLEIRSRVGIVRYAVRRGWLDDLAPEPVVVNGKH
jgi:two-component system, NarL family, response regulator NreC